MGNDLADAIDLEREQENFVAEHIAEAQIVELAA